LTFPVGSFWGCAVKEVLLIANSAWYLKNFRSSTIVALNNAGYRVCCLVPNDSPPALCDELHQLGAVIESFSFQAKGMAYASEARSLLSLFLVLRRRKPSLVFSFNPKSNIYASIACRVLSIAYVPNISGLGMADHLSAVRGILYRSAMRFFLMRARWVFFQNKENMQAVIQRNWVRASQCTLLPGSGVELDRFSPLSPSRPKEVGGRVFLMAARLLKAKGVAEYIEASRLISQQYGSRARLLLAGVSDDDERSIERSCIQQFVATAHCNYLGHIENMEELLKEVDCVVLPSYYPEGVPRILIEAIACGKVVITTDTPGCRDVLVNEVNGFFVQPGSADDVFQAMCRFMALSSDELAAMEVVSRRIAEESFDVNVVIQHYLQAAHNFIKF
jgi:glycosyltransferase involved in cell wall biosynthesis